MTLVVTGLRTEQICKALAYLNKKHVLEGFAWVYVSMRVWQELVKCLRCAVIEKIQITNENNILDKHVLQGFVCGCI